jgi:hypothetical protein
VTVPNILGSDHLTVIFHILDHVKIRNLSEPTEKFTDWERFQSLVSDLISPILEINAGVEAAMRRATSQTLLLRRVGCRQVRLHFLTLTPFVPVQIGC